MVKKLFKHEFLALFRLMLPVECAVLGTGILVRFMTLFENETFVYEAIMLFSGLIMFAALVAGNVATKIFGVIRYYKNLFTSEGYLSFTLPVTPAQHIAVKVITITVFDICALIIAAISFCFASSGELLMEIVKLISFLIEKALQELVPIHLVLFVFELIIAFIISIMANYLLYYGCITIGQTANKHRILLAIGVYAAYSMITSFIYSFFNIFVGVAMSLNTDIFTKIGELFKQHPYLCIHIVLISAIIIGAILATVFFFVSKIIIKKKLNLE